MKKYYRPNNNWGKPLWDFIHTICVIDFDTSDVNLFYSKKTVENLKALSNSFPCYKCKKHYEEALTEIELLDLGESMALFRWSFNLHNKINEKLGKPTISYEEAVQKYTAII